MIKRCLHLIAKNGKAEVTTSYTAAIDPKTTDSSGGGMCTMKRRLHLIIGFGQVVLQSIHLLPQATDLQVTTRGTQVWNQILPAVTGVEGNSMVAAAAEIFD